MIPILWRAPLLAVLAWAALVLPAFAAPGSFADHEDPVLRAPWAEGLEFERREELLESTCRYEARIEQGRAVMRHAMEIEDFQSIDHFDREHARIMIDDPKRACGYSRDSWIDLGPAVRR